MYGNFDDIHNLFLIAASKEQRPQRSSPDFSTVIGHQTVKAEKQAGNACQKNSSGSRTPEPVFTQCWLAKGKLGICEMESVQH
jgi:hypothetical protein